MRSKKSKEDNRTKADITIGSDRVFYKGKDVIIYSSCDMVDWLARNYRKTAVVFRSKTYFLARKSKLRNRIFRYKLEEWKDDYSDMPSKTIDYNEEYVEERDARYSEFKMRQRISKSIVIIQPLLGFLPSGQKKKLQEKYGLDPVMMTNYSLWIEYLFIIVTANLFVIQLFTKVFPLWFNFMPLAVILALIDAIMRYDNVLKEAASPYGFCEWLFTPKRK